MTGRLPGRPDAALDGRVVPVYAVTSGRTRSLGGDLPVESLVTATDRPDGLEKEYRVIVERATRPASLVEVAAWIGVPFGVARVLVGDLADAGYLEVHAPPPATPDGTPRPEHLIRLLEGLRAR